MRGKGARTNAFAEGEGNSSEADCEQGEIGRLGRGRWVGADDNLPGWPKCQQALSLSLRPS